MRYAGTAESSKPKVRIHFKIFIVICAKVKGSLVQPCKIFGVYVHECVRHLRVKSLFENVQM